MNAPDPITRLNAALEGRYRIESELGQGGMATVYLADDIKHERKVALKVLKPELAAVVGAERFLAEIKTTANLQHPHILPLFDSGEADSFLFYVMPYVEGETLRERIDRDKQLPVDEALGIATAVANALHTAHERGVVHRDIKPGNILLSQGQPLVADFGIALAVSAGGGGRLTETGLSLGTPYYMSPEQATGDQTVGPASDTFALACVLYEMLVGEPPYPGTTAQAVLGKIIQGLPVSATAIRRSVPANVDAAIRKALEKLPADRFTGAQDFAKALGDPGYRHGDTPSEAGARQGNLWRAVSIVTTITTVGLSAALIWLVGRPAPGLVARFDVTPGEGRALPADLAGIEFDLAADGQRIVYVGEGPGGELQLWDRRVDDLVADPIPGTEGADNPVISPDGQSVAFWEGTSLKTVSLLGGPVFTVVPEGGLSSRYFDWGDDGFLYFAAGIANQDFGIFKVAATGGQPERVTDPMPEVARVQLPEVLPEGKGVLVTLRRGDATSATIGVVGPEGGAVRELVPGMSARYSASGHIVYATADNTLMAAPFDLGALNTTGPPVPLLQGVRVRSPGLGAKFALAEDGSLIYRTGGTAAHQVVWVDRRGNVSQIDADFELAADPTYTSVAVSPDDNRLVISLPRDGGGWDLWTKQLPTGPLSRFSFEGGSNRRASWSVDGSTLTYIRNAPPLHEVRTARSDGAGEGRTVLANDVLGISLERPLNEAIFSRDGEWLVYRVGSNSNASNPDIYAMRVGVDTVGRPLLESGYIEWEAALSPDGRWLAYSSNETGRLEVYVRPFPDVGSGKFPISTAGGVEPRWSHSGTELFYREPLGGFVAVQVRAGSTFGVIGQEVLFPSTEFLSGAGYAMYDVGANDQRFIMLRASDVDASALILVQNFSDVLRARVPN